MIEKHGISCDTCKNYESLGEISFTAKIAKIKELGWKLYKIREMWFHRCPHCIVEKRIIPRQDQWWNRD